jgi:DNA-binding protein HU-beta
MNKAELVARMARESGLTKADANRAVDAFTGLVIRALKKGERVKLAGFGTFLVARRKARVVLNPATKAPVKIPSRRTARFTSSKELRAVLLTSGRAKS